MVSFAKTEDPPHQGQLSSHTLLPITVDNNTTMASSNVSSSSRSNSATIKKMIKKHNHRISSLNHVIANGDKTTEFLLKKKQENFNYLTVKILKEEQQQHLAALHFQSMYDHLLFLRKFM
jgi:hypothetical protein